MNALGRLTLAGLLAALPVAASAADCSRETLTVRGTPVTVSYCLASPPRQLSAAETDLPVVASYSAPGGSFSRTSTLHFVTGEGPSRVLENVELAPLGLVGTLHLTLVYAGGQVRVESALLTPGAITVK